jgi:2-oxoglutarate ferredoxin oxidoreductase subunit gamma
MRGGTANVTVIISDERISSPILNAYDTAIILNQQSMDKFEKTIKPGGLLIYDPNGITRHPERKDINIYTIEAADEAGKRGLSKIFNMIVLGGFLKLKPLVAPEFIHKGLEKSLPARHHNLIPDNEKAIEVGKELLKAVHLINA